MKVLIAEDDGSTRLMAQTALELLGHEVLIAQDGQEAVEVYARERPGVVLLDWMMPGLDGIAAAQKIRAIDGSGDTLIVLATAFDDATVLARALEAGIDDYMVKPLSMPELRVRLAITAERGQLRKERRAEYAALDAARQKAETVARARVDFIANMSHEIRTPLNGIVGMTDILRSTALSEEQRDCADTIKSCAGSLNALIADILDFSKIDAGRLDLESLPYDLYDLLAKLKAVFRPQALDKAVELIGEIEPGVPRYLRGDGERVRQIASNFVSNAIKFTKQGSVQIQIGIVHRAGERRLRISVSDTGIGIPVNSLQVIFQRFTQADASTARLYGGSGLGLSIVRQLTELMGGEVLVESTVGMGSTFSVVLPLEESSQGEVDARRTSDLSADLPLDWARPPRVLVVEDNLVNQRVAAKMLERMGCKVEIAENGQVAIDKMKQGEFDLVLMDLQMPVMDGLSAARWIRFHAEGLKKSVPIVGLSASSIPSAAAECQAAGMNGHLDKPVRNRELREMLLRVLRGH